MVWQPLPELPCPGRPVHSSFALQRQAPHCCITCNLEQAWSSLPAAPLRPPVPTGNKRLERTGTGVYTTLLHASCSPPPSPGKAEVQSCGRRAGSRNTHMHTHTPPAPPLLPNTALTQCSQSLGREALRSHVGQAGRSANFRPATACLSPASLTMGGGPPKQAALPRCAYPSGQCHWHRVLLGWPDVPGSPYGMLGTWAHSGGGAERGLS